MTKSSRQLITIKGIEENSRLNSTPRTSVFNQIGALTAQASVFTRLGNLN